MRTQGYPRWADPAMASVPVGMARQLRSPMKSLPLHQPLGPDKGEMVPVLDALDDDTLVTPDREGMLHKGRIIPVEALPEETLVYLDAAEGVQDIGRHLVQGVIGIIQPERHSQLLELQETLQGRR
ncbi:hypothetical protein D3C78_1519370 [compost metagenome]